mgnify:CR=1 FL=1|jgi:hypothetical protein
MTEQKTETTSAQINPLNVMLGLVDGVVRTGLSIASIPLGVLPADTNQKIRGAVSDVTNTVMDVPRGLSNTAQNVVDQAFGGSGKELEFPRIEEIGDRVREFTDRMAKSAQEVGNAVSSSVSGSAGSGEKKSGEKVDEWVEKKK